MERLSPSVPAKANVAQSTPAVTDLAGLDIQFEGEVEDQNDQQRKDQHGREKLARAELGLQVLPHDGEHGMRKLRVASARVGLLQRPG